MSDTSHDAYSMDLSYPIYVRTSGCASTAAEERTWYNEAERQWDLYHHLLGPKDKQEWYCLVPYLKFSHKSAKKISNHIICKATVENMTWAHVAMGRILWGVDHFLASRVGQRALEKYSMANLRELTPNLNGPTPTPSDVSMMDLDASNVSSNNTMLVPDSDDTKGGVLEAASAPINPFLTKRLELSESVTVTTSQPQGQSSIFETRAFDLKSPTKFNPDATSTPNAAPLARPRQYPQLQKYSNRVRGVNEEVKKLKSDLDGIKGQLGGLGTKYDEDVKACKKDVTSLQGRLDDLEGVVADLVEKGQQSDEELQVVKEWVVMFRDHLGLE